VKIAIIGANGQFGTDLVTASRSRGCEVISILHADCDVRDPASLDRALARAGTGDLVINTAAFHKTDECESRPSDAVAINTRGAYDVAAAAASRGAASVYVSTDYVFDGEKRTPYLESDEPGPLNVYGATKAAGEALMQQFPRTYVARISSIFGVAGSAGKGGNFVETMIARARAGETPRVVDDLVMSPTATADAAALLVDLFTRGAAPGVYHLSNAGACSWREFADEIFARCGFTQRAVPISAKETGAAARRPKYSALASERLAAYDLRARPWREALTEYLRAKGHIA
jgi:dTDP-4-dehydrorhamnose reductase